MDPSGIRLVVFDLDGTLVDTLEPTFRAFQEAVAPALGRVPTRVEILERFGPADPEIVSAWVGPLHAEAAIRRLYAAYEDAFRDSGPFPGMVDLLGALHVRGRRLALFTGRGRRSTDAVLHAMDLARWFEASVCGDEVPRPKPAPDGIRQVLALLDERPETAVYVGDTVKDLEAAAAAGVRFIAALWGSPERAALAEAAPTAAPEVADLARLLG